MKRRIGFDPRVQLLIVLITGLVSFLGELHTFPWLIGFIALYLAVQGIYKPTLWFLLTAALLYAAKEWSPASPTGLWTIVAFFSLLGLRLLPVLMAAVSLGRVPAGQLIVALRTVRIPMGVLVALAVSTRFLPILRLEQEAIQTNARLRGVSAASPRNWLRPLRTFEYTIVPLLMRSLKIADELAASAATKGIDHPGPKTSLYPVALRWQDAAVLLVYSCCLIALFGYGGLK
ncbi:energy-coupling factor transporter transmembrane component T [Paenibacillus senegalensis]|uniref:energy-coupling factor transporter transmembrane component T n=1 Tax=Paenibacillus senegalensis TaxID=1465766 RepID=UPI0002F44290|nr:energy-coupling factor transporter transmembrane component T [Paenibacillus senegalensis]